MAAGIFETAHVGGAIGGNHRLPESSVWRRKRGLLQDEDPEAPSYNIHNPYIKMRSKFLEIIYIVITRNIGALSLTHQR